MGYDTSHTLQMTPPLTLLQVITVFNPDLPWVEEARERAEDGEPEWEVDLSEYLPPEMSYALEAPEDDDDTGFWSSYENAKWSEDADLLQLSKAYPTVQFTLEVGDDIDSAPQYVSYYYGGVVESVSPTVTIPPTTLW